MPYEIIIFIESVCKVGPLKLYERHKDSGIWLYNLDAYREQLLVYFILKSYLNSLKEKTIFLFMNNSKNYYKASFCYL